MNIISLESIHEARKTISPYIRPTPLLPFDYLSQMLGGKVLVKCEQLQITGSFKLRGAANCVLHNLEKAKKAGVIAASAGNHAQGVAAICHSLGIKATIVMPEQTSPIKLQNTERWGAEIVLHGAVVDESFEHAIKLAEKHGYLFIHPFRDPLVMAGQGTLALELLEDPAFRETEAVVIPIGGGGLITGCASVLKKQRPELKIYGVTAKNAPTVWKSYHEGKVIVETVKATIADGIATKRADSTMLPYLNDLVDDVFSLSEESIAYAISLIAERAKLLAEGSAATTVASVLENCFPEKNVTLVLSGGNIDIPVFSHLLARGLVAQGRMVRLNIMIMDRPGGLHAVTGALAEKHANILQVFHQRSTLQAGVGEAELEVEIETRGPEHTEEIIRGITEKGFRVNRVL